MRTETNDVADFHAFTKAAAESFDEGLVLLKKVDDAVGQIRPHLTNLADNHDLSESVALILAASTMERISLVVRTTLNRHGVHTSLHELAVQGALLSEHDVYAPIACEVQLILGTYKRVLRSGEQDLVSAASAPRDTPGSV